MSSIGEPSATSREQRRDERRRRRNAQDSSTKQRSSEKKEKTPGKEDRKKKTDFLSANGGSSIQKKPPSGSKRLAYDKVNIIEKTSKFDTPAEKENKGEKANEGNKSDVSSSSSRRKLGSKFLDNLSKFETRAKQNEETKKEPFVRSFSAHSSNNDSSFRRSYRPPRSSSSVEDPSILVRRSLRKERVLESIAKLEKHSATATPSSLKKTHASPSRQRSDENKVKISSRPSSASSSKTSLSDSASSTSSMKGMTRAQQALERHKNRMRKTSQTSTSGTTPSPIKTPSSPATRSRSFSSEVGRRTPGKTKSKSKEPIEKTPPTEEESPTRKISVTKNPLEGDIVEVTTVAEIETPSDGKMSVVVKECTFSEEEMEKLISPTESLEYTLEDERPMSVEDAVAIFDLEEDKPLSPVLVPEPKSPPATRTRRKLPELPVQSPKRIRRKHSKKKKLSEDGSGEPCQEVVVIETTPTFQEYIPQEISPPKSEQCASLFNFNQNSSNIEQTAMKHEEIPMKHDQMPLKHEPKILEDDQKSLEHNQKSLKHDQKSPKRNKKSPNQDQKSPKQNQKSPMHDQKLLNQELVIIEREPVLSPEQEHRIEVEPIEKSSKHELKSLEQGQKSPDCDLKPSKRDKGTINCEEQSSTAKVNPFDPITVEPEPIQAALTIDEPIKFKQETAEAVLEKTYTPEDAIKVLRRLSEEVVYSGPIKSNDRSSVTESIVTSSIKEEETKTQDIGTDSTPNKKRRSKKKKEENQRPTSLHIEEVLYISDETRPKTASPVKSSPRLSLSEAKLTPSPKKSSEIKKKERKSSASSKELKRGITSPEIFSPQQDSKIGVKTNAPISLKRGSTLPELYTLPQDSARKVSIETNSLKSPVKTQIKTPESPKKSLPKSQTAKEELVDIEPPKSPTKIPEAKSLSPRVTPQSPLKSLKSPLKSLGSPAKQSHRQEEAATEAPPVKSSISQTDISETQMRDEIKMLGSKSIKPRVTKAKKTWVDESDSDDNISVLSDAGSDASDIDINWLGTDSEDESPKKKVTKPRSGSTGIQRSASKAQDMLKMWEKKAAEPKLKTSPARQTGKLGSSIAAWQNKSTGNGIRDSSSESLSEETRSEKSKSVTSNPTTPVRRSSSIHNGSRPTSTSECKVKEEETKEMQDIFDAKVTGKIQGAKALFENLSQSPVRSPSFQRSPRRQIEVKPKEESSEESPVVSRKSSLTDNVPTSRKSSTSHESDASSGDANGLSDGAEEALKVDNMRALFEKQANKKQEYKKQKTSLAEMVDNDCDITDVRSVKAMWESMDNHR